MARHPVAVQALGVAIDTTVKHHQNLAAFFGSSNPAEHHYQFKFVIMIRQINIGNTAYEIMSINNKVHTV